MTEDRKLFDRHLTVEEFGAALLGSGDLDPIYIMLDKAELEEEVLSRWLLAYWWFYHAGVASDLAETKQGFYKKALFLAQNKAPRGTERRHFRGQACLRSIQYFEKEFPDTLQMVAYLAPTRTLKDLMEKIKPWPLFGPWIGFKMADMLERIYGIGIEIPVEGFFDQPKEAAEMVKEQHPEMNHWTDAAKYLENHFATAFKAPPRFDRPVGVQEVETILCKWHSHLHDKYPIGKDTREIRHHLTGWGALAQQLKGYLPS